MAQNAFAWSSFSGPVGEAFESVGIEKGLGVNLLVASTVIILVAYFAGKPFRKQNSEAEPSARLDFPGVVQSVVIMLYEFTKTILGDHAIKFFWLMGGLFFFILTNNFLGLVPGFAPPTDNLNVTVTLGVTVFVLTHIVGIRLHGFSYVKHFLGPVWWLSWLIFPIEVISHLVRPVSLALRLFGNMTGDHKVVEVFFGILAVGLPVIFMGLGVLVSFLQAFVFLLLSLIYISGALEEAH